MTARELERLMVARYGEDFRDKVFVGPMGSFPLRDAFEECGLRDPREPARTFEPLPLPQQILPLHRTVRDTSPEATLRAALRYYMARYGPAAAGNGWRAWRPERKAE